MQSSKVVFIPLAISITLATGCMGIPKFERVAVAKKARSDMVGFSRGDVLGCMGAPARKESAGNTTVWTYYSGGASTSFSSGSANIQGKTVTGSSSTVTRNRSCTINVVMKNEIVQRVNYSGRTGGLLTKGEQCAYAVENCVN